MVCVMQKVKKKKGLCWLHNVAITKCVLTEQHPAQTFAASNRLRTVSPPPHHMHTKKLYNRAVKLIWHHGLNEWYGTSLQTGWMPCGPNQAHGPHPSMSDPVQVASTPVSPGPSGKRPCFPDTWLPPQEQALVPSFFPWCCLGSTTAVLAWVVGWCCGKIPHHSQSPPLLYKIVH